MNKTQMNLALLGDCKRVIKHVDPIAVSKCIEMADALRLAYEHSTISFSQVGLGKELGLGNGNSFKAWLKPKRDTYRPRHFDFNLVNDVEDLVGNDVLTQWVTMKLERKLRCQMTPEEQEAAVKEELYSRYMAQQA